MSVVSFAITCSPSSITCHTVGWTNPVGLAPPPKEGGVANTAHEGRGRGGGFDHPETGDYFAPMSDRGGTPLVDGGAAHTGSVGAAPGCCGSSNWASNPKFRVVLAGIGFFTDAYDLFVINIVLVFMRFLYPGAIADAPAVATAALVGAVLGQLFFGILADRCHLLRMFFECVCVCVSAVVSLSLSVFLYLSLCVCVCVRVRVHASLCVLARVPACCAATAFSRVFCASSIVWRRAACEHQTLRVHATHLQRENITLCWILVARRKCIFLSYHVRAGSGGA